jgi:hypothetical protein
MALIAILVFLWVVMLIYVNEFGSRLYTVFIEGKKAVAPPPGPDYATLSAGAVVSFIAAFYGVTLAAAALSGRRTPGQVLRSFGSAFVGGVGTDTVRAVAGLLYTFVYFAIALACYFAYFWHHDLTPDILSKLPVTAIALAAAIGAAWVATKP